MKAVQRYAAVSGTLASLATSGILMLLAKAEGKSPWQPANATSHWMHGPRAGKQKTADAAHTAVGLATHHASAMFWSLPFSWWASRRPRTASELFVGASVTTAVAAAVDYLVVPRRATPGWEHALSKESIAATYVALAAGLAAGALMVQESDRDLF
jgi:hypothetical protein